MSTNYVVPALDTTAQGILAALNHGVAESAKQTLLLSHIAQTTVGGAAAEDWDEVANIVQNGLAPSVFPSAVTKLNVPLSTKASSSAEAVAYSDDPWDVALHNTGALQGGSVIPVMHMQMHYCLPFDTQFSPRQAFLYAIDGLPAGTYHVTLDADTYGRTAGNYQFTLTQALPAKGQLRGFFADGAAANVTAWESASAASATETCAVTSGNEGTYLGTFSVAGDQAVPASGTPAASKTITIDGADYHVYGLNSTHRVSYGNNRWLHSAIRQWLNASGFDWWKPATVFDVKPGLAARQGFMSGLPEDFLAHVQPIARKTALNYKSDGGSAGAPEHDTTYDRFTLISGREHFLADNADFGGGQGQEGEAFDYWKRVSGVSSPRSWWNTYPEYVQYDLATKTTARNVWMRSAYRYNAYYAAYISSSGSANNYYANNARRAAPACAIG